jgi:hypothetical protein
MLSLNSSSINSQPAIWIWEMAGQGPDAPMSCHPQDRVDPVQLERLNHQVKAVGHVPWPLCRAPRSKGLAACFPPSLALLGFAAAAVCLV